jgi:hypothetical protein
MTGRLSRRARARHPWQACQKVLLICSEVAQQLLDPREVAERSGVPPFVHASAALDEQACHSPAAVPDRVVQRAAARN